MEPGVDCMSCHIDSAFRWTVAGTVYGRPDAEPHDGVGGAEVVLTDVEGRVLTLRTNSSGNFFTREELQFPLDVEIRRDGRSVRMETPTATGSCNGCHNVPAVSDAPGRVYAP